MLTFNLTFKVKEMSLNLEIMKSFLNIEIFLKTIDQLFAEIFQRFFSVCFRKTIKPVPARSFVSIFPNEEPFTSSSFIGTVIT